MSLTSSFQPEPPAEVLACVLSLIQPLVCDRTVSALAERAPEAPEALPPEMRRDGSFLPRVPSDM